MSKTALKDQIEQKLKTYIHRFIRYAGFSHLTPDRREIIAGTFIYLIDDHDLIPDDVPNIGFLDDLMVFVEAAKHFLSTGIPIAGVCDPQEVMADSQFVQKNSGMMFTNQHLSIDTIRNMGRKHVDELPALCKQIKVKYATLGEFENEED